MIVVGTDVHKGTHTFVAVDSTGRQLDEITVNAVTSGHHRALRWAQQVADGDQVMWAVEDCRNLSNRLERDLLKAGQSVVRVAPPLMAAERRTGRQRGKSDPIDALAVARVALREPDLPVAEHDETTYNLKALTDHRDHLVAYRTSLINRLRELLHRIDPEYVVAPAVLTRSCHQQRVRQWLGEHGGLAAELGTELLDDIITLTGRITDYGARIRDRVAPIAPSLLQIDGVSFLTAGKIVGEVANIGRFATDDKFARYNGTAPVPVWSGKTAGRVRLTRSGNRQLNRAIHTAALTQARMPDSDGHAYCERKKAEGKTPREALRCLKRRISRRIYVALSADAAARSATTQTTLPDEYSPAA